MILSIISLIWAKSASHRVSAKISTVFPVIFCPAFTSYSKAIMRSEAIAFRFIFLSIVSIIDLLSSLSRIFAGIYLQYSLMQRETWLRIWSSIFYLLIISDNVSKIFINDSGLRLMIFLNSVSDRFLMEYLWYIIYGIRAANSCMRAMSH